MMDLIIGIGLLLYLIAGVAYGLTYTFYGKLIIQLVVCLVGSIFILGRYGLNYFNNKQTKPEKEEDMELELPEDRDKNSLTDFKALHYLKERVIQIDCPEALELVVKLNTILFSQSDCEEGSKDEK